MIKLGDRLINLSLNFCLFRLLMPVSVYDPQIAQSCGGIYNVRMTVYWCENRQWHQICRKEFGSPVQEFVLKEWKQKEALRRNCDRQLRSVSFYFCSRHHCLYSSKRRIYSSNSGTVKSSSLYRNGQMIPLLINCVRIGEMELVFL